MYMNLNINWRNLKKCSRWKKWTLIKIIHEANKCVLLFWSGLLANDWNQCHQLFILMNQPLMFAEWMGTCINLHFLLENLPKKKWYCKYIYTTFGWKPAQWVKHCLDVTLVQDAIKSQRADVTSRLTAVCSMQCSFRTECFLVYFTQR